MLWFIIKGFIYVANDKDTPVATLINKLHDLYYTKVSEYNANEVEQLRNEKNPLSGEGERKAKILSEVEELSSVKNIYSWRNINNSSVSQGVVIDFNELSSNFKNPE